MWKRNFKLILIALVLLLGLNLFNCEENFDLSLEDEDSLTVDKAQPIKKIRNQYEEEEFDDPNLLRQPKIKNSGQINQPKGVPSGMTIPPSEQHGMDGDKRLHFAFYEILMVVFVIGFIISSLIGKNINENLAQKWYSTNQVFLEDNYAHIGVNSEYNPNQSGVPILKESYNNYKFYASGRKFVKWMLINMDFKKRQDLVSLCTSIFLFNEKDRIVYEASIIPLMELPLVFCLCKKKDVKNMKKSYSDIDFFTKAYNPSFMSDNLIFLTEDYETFDMMFSDKEFVSIYSKVQPYIDIIYYTDRQTYTKEENAIFFSFDINVSANTTELFANLTTFVHMFIDLLCTAKISTNHKREAEKMRLDYDKFRAKELQEKNVEEMRQKKAEKQNATKSKKNLTVEQAQKLDERNKKENMKDQKKKQMKVVKK